MEVPFGIGRSHLTGPIIDGVCIRQGFQAATAELKSIEIAFGTYMRANPGEMTIAVHDVRDNSLVVETKCMVADFADNSYHTFEMNCELIPGRPYELRVFTLDCRSGESVTGKYCRKLHHGHHLFIGARLIKDGELSAIFHYEGESPYAPPQSSEMKSADPTPEPPRVNMGVPGLVSVVIPHFNCYDLLAQCLASLTRQTYNAIEVIVVDDGSTESGRTEAIVGAYKPLLMPTFVAMGQNEGAPAARNRGAKYASGEYLLFLDADCVMYPNAFRIFMDTLMDNPAASWAYGGFRWGAEIIHPAKWNADKLMGRNFCSTMSMMRAADFPGWDENLKRHQDWDMWLTMLAEGKLGACTDRYMFESPKRHGSISTDGNIDMMKSINIIRRKHGL